MPSCRTLCLFCILLLVLVSRPALEQDANTEKYPPGLVVLSITKDSVAERAGLRVADVLLSLDGVPVRFQSQIIHIRDKARWDEKKALTAQVRRGAETLTLQMTVSPLLGFSVRPPLPANSERLYTESASLSPDQSVARRAKLMGAVEAAEKAGDLRSASWLWCEIYLEAPVGTEDKQSVLNHATTAAEAAGDQFLFASCLNNLGGIAYDHGKLDEAEAFYKHALSIGEKRAPNSLSLTASLHNLGIIAHARRKPVEAEEFLKRALAIKEKLDPESLDMAKNLDSLGVVIYSRGKFDEAERFYRRALALFERFAPDSLDLARCLNDLGNVTRARGRFDEAEGFLKRALAIKAKVAPDSLDLARSIHNLGGFTYHRGKLDEAEKFFKRALALFEKLTPYSPNPAISLHSLGAVAYDRGKLEEAEEFYGRAVTIREKLAPNSLDAAASLHELGIVVHDRSKLEKAEELFARAWRIVRAQGAQVTGDRGRQEFGEANAFYAANLLLTQLQRKRFEAAFITLEQGRGQALVQAMAEREVTERLTPPSIWRTYQTTANQHNVAFKEAERSAAPVTTAKELLKAHEEQKADEALLSQDRKRLQEAEQAFKEKRSEEIRTRGEMEDAWKAVLNANKTVLPAPVDPNTARNRLPPGTLLLEFSVAQKEVTLFVVTAESVRAFTLEAKREELEAKLKYIRAFVARDTDDRPAKPASGSAVEQDALRTLFVRLFPPEAQAANQVAKRVVISPDDFLWDLPFAALITNKNGIPVYLGLEKPLSYTQSLTIYFTPGPAGGKPATGALVVGDPVYDSDRRAALLAGKGGSKSVSAMVKPKAKTGTVLASTSPRPARRSGELGMMTRNGEAPQQLPFAEKEAKQVASLYRTSAHIGIEPTENWFRQHASQAKILHLATHGYLHPYSGQSSGVLLAVPDKDAPLGQYDNDGALQAWEVWSLKLNADLVVLSACETGRGAKVTGEGLIGLTRAWQYAGAKTIVSSQWKVSDESTAALMTAFHKRLLAGVEKDEALRMAMVEVAKSGTGAWSSPYHWAAFVLVGDTGRMR